MASSKKSSDKNASDVVEISLNPDELDLNPDALQAKYDQAMREQKARTDKEDFSDMLANHNAKQQKKRKKQQQQQQQNKAAKTSKKNKEYKFTR